VVPGGALTEGGMAPFRVVPALDEFKDRPFGFPMGGETLAVDQFALQCGEKALGDGVVVAVPDRAHGLSDIGFLAALAKGQRPT